MNIAVARWSVRHGAVPTLEQQAEESLNWSKSSSIMRHHKSLDVLKQVSHQQLMLTANSSLQQWLLICFVDLVEFFSNMENWQKKAAWSLFCHRCFFSWPLTSRLCITCWGFFVGSISAVSELAVRRSSVTCSAASHLVRCYIKLAAQLVPVQIISVVANRQSSWSNGWLNVEAVCLWWG